MARPVKGWIETAVFVVSMAIIVFVVMFATIQMGGTLTKRQDKLEQQVAQIQSSIGSIKVVNGKNGVDGTTTTVITYTPGKDGQNASEDQIIKAVNEHFAKNPIKTPQDGKDGVDGKNGTNGADGAKGDQGERGPAIFLRTNPETGVEECRYAGDTSWQPATECR